MDEKYIKISNNFFPQNSFPDSSFNPFKFYFPGCSVKKDDEESNICPICLSLISTLKGRPNSCNHVFCYECINLWFQSSSICPICRRKILKLIKF